MSDSDRIFAGQRKTTYEEAKNETLRTFFHKYSHHSVVMAGPVATHLKCGLIEAENLLERMVRDGVIRYATAEETLQYGACWDAHGYVRVEDFAKVS